LRKEGPQDGQESAVDSSAFVRVGEARGDFVSILDGLKPNETIVSTGVSNCATERRVTIDNTLAPKPQVNPTPADS